MQRSYNNKIKGIYAITPDYALNINAIEKTIIQHKVSILQYRRKTANKIIQFNEVRQLKKLCLKHNALLIVNDDINLAHKIKADGVHLGKDDPSIQEARAKLGADAIVGVSCYDDVNLALTASHQGADYVAFGALFASKTKKNAVSCSLHIIKQAKQLLSIPIVGIGGIDFNTQHQAFNAGCDAVAMISALQHN